MTPEDRSFFETINKDLANSIGLSIQNAFDNESKRQPFGAGVGSKVGLDGKAIKDLANAIADSMKKEFGPSDSWGVGEDGGGGSGDGKDGTPQKRQWGKFFKAVGSFIAQSKIAANAANALKDTVRYGNIVARGAVATNNKSALGTDLLSKKFEQFGVKLPEIGQIFQMAMKAGAGPLTESQAELFASTKLFDANMQSMIDLQSKGTHVLGLSTKQSETLGSDILHLAKANGVYADSIIDAVAGMEGTMKSMALVFGGESTAEYMGGAARLQAATKGLQAEGVTGLLSQLSQSTTANRIQMQAIAGIVGGNTATTEMLQTNPTEYLTQMITIIGRASSQLADKSWASQAQKEAVLNELGGFNDAQLTAARTLFEKHGEKGIRDILNKEISDSDKAATESKMAITQLEASKNLQDAMLDNATAVANLDTAMDLLRTRFDVMSTALTGPLRDLTIGARTGAGVMNLMAPLAMGGAQLWGMHKLLGAGGAAAGGGGLASLGLRGSMPPPSIVGPSTPIPRTRRMPKIGRGRAGLLLSVAAMLGLGSLAYGGESEGGGGGGGLSDAQFRELMAAMTGSASRGTGVASMIPQTSYTPAATVGGSLWSQGPRDFSQMTGAEASMFGMQGLEMGLKSVQVGKMAKAGTLLGKAGGKSFIKKIPILGAIAGLVFGVQRAMEGDWVGAGGELLSGGLSMIPGLGTAASVGVDAALLGRDMHAMKTGRDLSTAQNQVNDVLFAVNPALGLLNAGTGNMLGTAMFGSELEKVNDKLTKIAESTAGTATLTGDSRSLSERQLLELQQLRREAGIVPDLHFEADTDSRQLLLTEMFGGVASSVDSGG